MIVCHRHRFIFVNTRHTAGASVEAALSRYCGDTDILTHNIARDASSGAEMGARGRQNDTLPFSLYRLHDWIRLIFRGKRARLRGHASAAEIRAVVGSEVWDDYFKFCVERDPWDKAVSLYNSRTRHLDPRPTLLKFLGAAKQRSLSNFHLYTIEGALALDRVIRFEYLVAEVEALRNLLDLPEPLILTSAKISADDVHYSALFGPDEKALIDAACSREITLFGYGFCAEAPVVRGG